MHLGSPLKVIYIFLSPNPSSPLWWLAVLYHVYIVILLAAFWRIHTGKLSKTLGMLIFMIAIFTSTTLGWLLGMTDARPALNASFFSFYFPLTGFASGVAAVILFSILSEYFSGREISEDRDALYNEAGRLMGIVAGMVLVLFLWRSVSGGISSTALEYGAFKHMIGSIPYHIELWLGLVIPTALMLVPSIRVTVWGKLTASVLLLIGMFEGRLEFVLSGVVRPLGQMAEGRPEIVSYVPTIYEILVAFFGLSVMLLIYTIGERYLKLEAVPE
jgi:molybdopterin-containing oxidoreductase family membrane subunit